MSLLGIVLGACDGRPGATGSGDVPPAPPVPDPTTPLRDYTHGDNRLGGLGGIAMTARAYAELDIPHRPATAELPFSTGLLDQGQAALKSARAESSSLPVVDAQADTLLGAVDRLQRHLDALRTYYDEKSYRDDRLARGRREDPQLRAEFAAALDALGNFDAALATARARQDVVVLTQLRARGDALSYATRLAVQQGGALAALLPDVAASRDPRVLARADAATRALEATLVTQRQAYADAQVHARPNPTTGDDGAPDLGHAQVARQLTAMVGAFRDLRQDHRQDDFDDLREKYTGAVESAYDITTAP